MSLFKSTKKAEHCPNCGAILQIKKGKKGLFLGCSNYPDCDYIKPLHQTAHVVKTLEETCPDCGHFLQIKQGQNGMFIGCSHYPDCHFIVQEEREEESEHFACPECQQAQLVSRKGRSGKLFYGCASYPHCKFTLAGKPVEKPCPVCQFPLSVVKKSSSKVRYQCGNKGCQHLFDDSAEG